jgi:hypothetical protein
MMSALLGIGVSAHVVMCSGIIHDEVIRDTARMVIGGIAAAGSGCDNEIHFVLNKAEELPPNQAPDQYLSSCLYRPGFERESLRSYKSHCYWQGFEADSNRRGGLRDAAQKIMTSALRMGLDIDGYSWVGMLRGVLERANSLHWDTANIRELLRSTLRGVRRVVPPVNIRLDEDVSATIETHAEEAHETFCRQTNTLRLAAPQIWQEEYSDMQVDLMKVHATAEKLHGVAKEAVVAVRTVVTENTSRVVERRTIMEDCVKIEAIVVERVVGCYEMLLASGELRRTEPNVLVDREYSDPRSTPVFKTIGGCKTLRQVIFEKGFNININVNIPASSGSVRRTTPPPCTTLSQTTFASPVVIHRTEAKPESSPSTTLAQSKYFARRVGACGQGLPLVYKTKSASDTFQEMTITRSPRVTACVPIWPGHSVCTTIGMSGLRTGLRSKWDINEGARTNTIDEYASACGPGASLVGALETWSLGKYEGKITLDLETGVAYKEVSRDITTEAMVIGGCAVAWATAPRLLVLVPSMALASGEAVLVEKYAVCKGNIPGP